MMLDIVRRADFTLAPRRNWEWSRQNIGGARLQLRFVIQLANRQLDGMLIAATDKGICSIQFADSDEELEQGLKQEFPFALRRRDDDGMATLAGQVVQRMSGVESSASLPLDIQATAFQRRVWCYLQSIAFGKTRSYTEVAKAIRHPSAVRAVARACGLIPWPLRSRATACCALTASLADIDGAWSARKRFSKWNRPADELVGLCFES